MKISVTNGKVTAEAETLEEVQQLLGMKVVRKHKKHRFTKTCELCGKGYKGFRGLALHKAKMHKESVVL